MSEPPGFDREDLWRLYTFERNEQYATVSNNGTILGLALAFIAAALSLQDKVAGLNLITRAVIPLPVIAASCVLLQSYNLLKIWSRYMRHLEALLWPDPRDLELPLGSIMRAPVFGGGSGWLSLYFSSILGVVFGSLAGLFAVLVWSIIDPRASRGAAIIFSIHVMLLVIFGLGFAFAQFNLTWRYAERTAFDRAHKLARDFADERKRMPGQRIRDISQRPVADDGVPGGDEAGLSEVGE